MKISFKIVSATAALALGLLSPMLLAQENPPPPPPDGGPGGCHKNPQDGFLKMLTEKLSLTQEQQTKVKAVLDDERAAMDALRDSQPDRETGHAQMEAIIKTHRDQIRALLTTEQQKIFDQIKPGEHRGPPPPPPDEN